MTEPAHEYSRDQLKRSAEYCLYSIVAALWGLFYYGICGVIPKIWEKM